MNLLKKIELYLRYKREINNYQPSPSLEKKALNNIKYTFGIIESRIPSKIYDFDYHALKKAKNLEDVITKLPVTTPEHYVENLDHYNNWVKTHQDIVSAVVLSSGTTGKPKNIRVHNL